MLNSSKEQKKATEGMWINTDAKGIFVITAACFLSFIILTVYFLFFPTSCFLFPVLSLLRCRITFLHSRKMQAGEVGLILHLFAWRTDRGSTCHQLTLTMDYGETLPPSGDGKTQLFDEVFPSWLIKQSKLLLKKQTKIRLIKLYLGFIINMSGS